MSCMSPGKQDLLKITFDDDVDGNTFVYPSENSLLEDPDQQSPSPTPDIIPNGQSPPSKLKTNTSIGNSNFESKWVSKIRII
ncbi:hypothetical protein CDAR_253781 [Caerostris darwini]|uniref:Uncharacterized protein n=1 Tax=Caerostris darwini TaxID=1538125 RepID=A0AAV4Q489_9ARAC|nr:hypothetical protein CDAR_253781 [Caerostris darwini]